MNVTQELCIRDRLKEEVCADLQAEADSQFFNAAGSELLNEVINNSEVTSDPDAVDDMFNQLKTTYSSYASSYGMDFDQFLSMFLGTDEDGLRDTAENLVKQQLVLDAIQAQDVYKRQRWSWGSGNISRIRSSGWKVLLTRKK